MMPTTPSALEMFDPRGVQLSWRDRRWLLVSHGRTLKDFGTNVEEARLALRLIHELGLNQHGVIGSPVPRLEYWLVDGHAPGPLPRAGMYTFPIEPDRLRADQVQGRWVVRDENRVLFTFAQNADEAREALAVLQKHHFTHVGIVGQVVPTMVVFGGDGRADFPTLAAGGAARPFAPLSAAGLIGSDGKPRIEPMKGAQGARPAGYEGVVQPLIRPLSVPANAAPSGGMPASGNFHPVGFQTTPHFDNQGVLPGAGQEERCPFDWRQVQLRQDNGGWKLAAGGRILAGFGNDLPKAQLALAAIRYYRFNERRGPGDGSACFLAHPASPRGLMSGLRGTEFRPDKLEVQHLVGGYALCQGPIVVLRFGDRPEPARDALEVIQRFEHDRACQIGVNGQEGMTILLKAKDEFRLPPGASIMPAH